jgi:hypothetical protein
MAAVSTNPAVIPVGSWTLLAAGTTTGILLSLSSGPVKIAYAAAPPVTFDGVRIDTVGRMFSLPGVATPNNIYATAIGQPARIDWIVTG